MIVRNFINSLTVRKLSLVNETLSFETLSFETETFGFQSETRPRPTKISRDFWKIGLETETSTTSLINPFAVMTYYERVSAQELARVSQSPITYEGIGDPRNTLPKSQLLVWPKTEILSNISSKLCFFAQPFKTFFNTPCTIIFSPNYQYYYRCLPYIITEQLTVLVNSENNNIC